MHHQGDRALNPGGSAAPRHAPGARRSVQAIETSLIREVFDYGQQFGDVVPMWFGEPDVVTPAFIREAAKASLDAGETFYSSNLGIPPLRAAIAAYLGRLRRPVASERIAVTLSGVSALSLAAQCLIEPGERVIVVDPVWPNLTEIPKIMSARLERFSLNVRDGRWTLDVERLLDALGDDARMLWINSPGNPTGFVLDRGRNRPSSTTAGARAPGSSPTTSMIGSTTRATSPRRSSTSPIPTTAWCRPTASRRPGR